VEFSVTRPKSQGVPPPARFMHSMAHLAKVGLLVVFGGRNDSLLSNNVLGDMWALELASLEWKRVSVASSSPVGLSPRFNHAVSYTGDELIICGGQGSDFRIRKDLQILKVTN
jgi:hypothetical protein